MNFYRPPTKSQKLADRVLELRRQFTSEIQAKNPNLSPAEVEGLVVNKMQCGPPPTKPGIPPEVLEARRKERRETLARGKSARLGDKRPGKGARERLFHKPL